MFGYDDIQSRVSLIVLTGLNRISSNCEIAVITREIRQSEYTDH